MQVLNKFNIELCVLSDPKSAVAEKIEQLFPVLKGVIMLAYQEADKAELKLSQHLVHPVKIYISLSLSTFH